MGAKGWYRDQTGKRWGKLTAIEYRGQSAKRNRSVWLFRCDCGGTQIAPIQDVQKGNFQYCDDCDPRFHGIDSIANNLYRNRYADGDITLDQFRYLSGLDCFYCGEPPSQSQTRSGLTFRYNGLDRLDNSLGHTLANVVPCCWPCNRKKNRDGFTQFLGWINRVYHRTKHLVPASTTGIRGTL